LSAIRFSATARFEPSTRPRPGFFWPATSATSATSATTATPASPASPEFALQTSLKKHLTPKHRFMSHITFRYAYEGDTQGDRTYTAFCGDNEFDVCAQLWDEDGAYQGNGADALMMHYGIKSCEDPLQHFSEDPAWPAFSEAAGVSADEFETQFIDMIEA